MPWRDLVDLRIAEQTDYIKWKPLFSSTRPLPSRRPPRKPRAPWMPRKQFLANKFGRKKKSYYQKSKATPSPRFTYKYTPQHISYASRAEELFKLTKAELVKRLIACQDSLKALQ